MPKMTLYHMSALPMLIAIVQKLAIPYLQDTISPIVAIMQNVPINQKDRIILLLEAVLGHAILHII
jgi:hypothetical protein